MSMSDNNIYTRNNFTHNFCTNIVAMVGVSDHELKQSVV